MSATAEPGGRGVGLARGVSRDLRPAHHGRGQRPSPVDTGSTLSDADPGDQRWARTVEVDDRAAADVVAAGEFCWLSPTTQIAGWGAALRLDVEPASGADPSGYDADRTQRAAGSSRVSRAAAQLDRWFSGLQIDGGPAGAGPLAFASLTFDPNARGSSVVVPRTIVRRRGGRAWLTVVADRPVAADDPVLPSPGHLPSPQRRVRYAGTTATEIAWIDAVDRAVRRIRAGEAEKVVLARDRVVYSNAPFDVPALIARLRARFPTCYTFRVDGLIGASPELLIRRTGRRIDSLVLAGTAPRGRDEAEDLRIGEAFLASTKDLAEHRPAVASVRDALRPLAEHLDVDRQPHLLRLANVQHLATGIRGTLATDVDALSLAERLHPTAAIGGTPTDRALALIAELETIDRGRYAGPVGWVDADGDGEFAIALRCAQIDGVRARLFAGAGIVAESLPEAELEETRLKLRAMQSAFG